MMARLILSTGIVVALALGSWSAAAQPDSLLTQSRVNVDPVGTINVRPGHEQPVEFVFHILKGYHINSNRPLSEELKPTQLRFSVPGDLVIGRVQYPVGEMTSFPFDPENKISVYSGAVVVKAAVIARSNASPGPYTIHGDFSYQACDNNACYPPKKLALEFTVKVSNAPRKHPRSSPQSPHIH